MASDVRVIQHNARSVRSPGTGLVRPCDAMRQQSMAQDAKRVIAGQGAYCMNAAGRHSLVVAGAAITGFKEAPSRQSLTLDASVGQISGMARPARSIRVGIMSTNSTKAVARTTPSDPRAAECLNSSVEAVTAVLSAMQRIWQIQCALFVSRTARCCTLT